MQKSFIALLVATIVVLVGAGWAVWDQEQSNLAQNLPRGPIFAQLTAPGANVGELDVTTPAYKIQLVHKGDQWLAASNGNYPIRGETADSLVKQIASLQLREAKTRNPLWYSRVNVEDAGVAGSKSSLVHIAGDGLQPADLIVGSRSASVGTDPTGATFVRRPGDDQAWLAEGIVTLPNVLGDWFDQVVHVPGPQVQEVAISEGTMQVFDAAKDKGASDYTLKSVDPRYADKGKFANDSEVKGMEAGIVSVTVSDVRSAASVTFAPDARTVTFLTGDGLTVKAKLGQADGKTWVTYTASAAPGSSAATTADGINKRAKDWAFLLPQAKVDALSTPVAQLLQTQAAPQPSSLGGPPGGLPGGQTPGSFLSQDQLQDLLRRAQPVQ